MCGIIGVFLLNKPDCEVAEPIRRKAAMLIHNELLLHTRERGRDATGVVASLAAITKEEWLVKTGGNAEEFPEFLGKDSWYQIKQPIASNDFLKNDGTQSKFKEQDSVANPHLLFNYLRNSPRRLRYIIGHTRKKTTGSEFNYLNNHPIKVGNIIGVHNGSLDNADYLFENIYKNEMKRLGEVDSEIIMQLLNMQAPDRGLEVDDAKFVADRLDGAYAVIAFNTNHPDQVLIFRNSLRPMEPAYIPELGIAVVASTHRLLEDAMETYDRITLSDNQLPRVSLDKFHGTMHKAGVIDLSTQYQGDIKAEDVFEMHEIGKNPKKKYTVPKTVKKNTSSQATGQSKTSYNSTPVNKGTKVKDHSEYPASNQKSTDDETEILELDGAEAKSIEDDEDEKEEEKILEELRMIGINRALELMSDKKTRDNLLPEKEKGNMAKKYGPDNFSNEKLVAEIIENAYIDIFADGFTDGIQYGEAVAQDEMSDEVDNLKADLKDAKRSLAAVSKTLEAAKLRNSRSGDYIANLKMLLLALLIKYDAAYVNEDGNVEFSNEVHEILSSKTFSKVDLVSINKMLQHENTKKRLENGAKEIIRNMKDG